MVSTMKMVDTKTRPSRSAPKVGVRVNRTGRRTYSAEYKRGVVQECGEPGVSVARVAMTHAINANLVRRWIMRQRRTPTGTIAQSPTVLLPISVQRETPMHEVPAEGVVSTPTRPRRAGSAIEIELYGARIHLRGEVDAQALDAVLEVLSRR